MQEIRKRVIERYPHLRHIHNDKEFARNVLRLYAVKDLSGFDYYKLMKILES